MLKSPVLTILRGVSKEELFKLCESFIRVGIDTLEITMNTVKAAELITAVNDKFGDKLHIGAGTVTTIDELEEALKAGAKFIVTPVVNKDVIRICIDKNIPVIPGALTPTEIFEAWQMGALMIKVFPASLFGPKYFKEVLGPLNTIKLMAVGGVNATNIEEYFMNGAKAVAVGGSLMSKERMNADRYDLIENDLSELINKANKSTQDVR